MYDKILVPLDGSELAEVPMWYATRLAVRLGATLTLVYVVTSDDFTSEHMRQCYLDDVVNKAIVNAKTVSGPKGSEVNIEYKMLKGNPAEEILKFADKNKIDCIVMSTQGKSGISRWSLGNVAHKVVKGTTKQVLLIRAAGTKPDFERTSLNKVLVPVDGTKPSESVLKYISYLAIELGLEVTVLHMMSTEYSGYPKFYPSRDVVRQVERLRTRQQAYVDKLGARLKDAGVNVNVVFKEILVGEEAAEIIKMADEEDYSMVAMATHGRSGLGRWVYGSVANKVLNEGATPLLLIHPRNIRLQAEKAAKKK